MLVNNHYFGLSFAVVTTKESNNQSVSSAHSTGNALQWVNLYHSSVAVPYCQVMLLWFKRRQTSSHPECHHLHRRPNVSPPQRHHLYSVGLVAC